MRLYDAYPEHFGEFINKGVFSYVPECTIEGAALKELYENPQLIGTKSKIALEKSSMFFNA